MTDEELKGLFTTLREEIGQELSGLRTENAETRQYLETSLAAVHAELAEMRAENAEAHSDTRAYVDQGLGALREHVDEGLGAVREHADTNIASLRDHVDKGLGEVRDHADKGLGALREHVDKGLGENRDHADTIVASLRDHVDDGFSTVRRENAAAHVETRRHMDVIGEHIAERFQFLVETVQFVDQKLDRNVAHLEERIDRSAIDTQSLVRYAYGQLDQRISRLE